MWEALTKEAPLSQAASPRTGAYHEEGPFLDGMLATDATSDRLDVTLVAAVVEGTASVAPSLGSFEAIGAAFLDLCVHWLRAQPSSFRRIALGVTARIPTVSLAAGYEKLAEFLRDSVNISTNSSDFFYQINRPRDSKAKPGIKLNRLSRWSVQRTQYAAFTMHLAQPTASTILGDPSYACRVELDLNTTADNAGDLAAIDLLTELKELAAELLEGGDVA